MLVVMVLDVGHDDVGGDGVDRVDVDLDVERGDVDLDVERGDVGGHGVGRVDVDMMLSVVMLSGDGVGCWP